MCTSLVYQDQSHHHYLARTMDFPTTTPWRPIFLPRGYNWPTGVHTTRQTRYALIGDGRLPVHFDSCLMADGVNEHGLACAELYLPHAVHYALTTRPGWINLTPQGFINWVLGEHASVAAVIADLPRVNLVAGLWGHDDQVYPFHWLLADQTGRQVVIEPTGGPLVAQSNPSGVLTNTPVLARHLENLNHYLGLRTATFSTATVRAAKHWVATRQPLPTGSVPTERFIHMAILRLGHTPQATISATDTLMDWLRAVSLPYDPAKRQQLSHNYAHYRSVLDLTTRTLTFEPRTTLHRRRLQLTPAMARDWHVPFVFRAE